MKILSKILISFMLLLWSFTALTQQRIITGVVYNQDNVPLVGVNISLEGTPIGALTNANGEFSINTRNGKILIFTSVGYQEEKVVLSNQNNLKIIMKKLSLSLDEVVVTALGITRSEKSLGYAVSKLSNEDITGTVSSTWLNGMAGKVAGLTLNQPTTPMGSTRVTLRGESSLNPNNSAALFVLDGVPINSSLEVTGGSTSYSTTGVDNPIDYGDAINDLDPNNIESVTILKGPSATALYGSQAANGAIVITTKSGRTEKGVGVNFSSSLTYQKPSYWPDLQNEYGMGAASSDKSKYGLYAFTDEDGTVYTVSSQNQAWGPRFEGQLFPQYAGMTEDGEFIKEKTPWIPRDWYKGIYKTGTNLVNNLSIEGNNGKGFSGRVSFSNTDDKWILPNTGNNTKSLIVSTKTNINRFAQLTTRLIYSNRKSDNLPQNGLGRGTVPYLLMWGATGADINWYKDYKLWTTRYANSARNNVFYANSDGPYFSLYENLNTLDRHRFYENTELSINITPRINLMLRSSIEMYNDFRTQRKAYNSVNYIQGRYREQLLTSASFNNDFLLKYTKNLGSFDMLGMVGGNLSYRKSNNSTVVANGMDIEGQYTLSNSITQLLPTVYRSNKQTNSLYGMLNLGYKDKVFLDITGRNDWSSALKKGNNSYFYPSVSLSALLTDIFKLPKQFSLLKLRSSWANVGNDTRAYVINSSYSASTFGGGLLMPTTFANPDIKPEMVESWEFGFESKLFKSRLGLDVAFYHATSYNQIVNTPVDPATGFQTILFNAGKLLNSGWEISLTGQPIRTKNVRWNTSIVYTRNSNKVIELAEGVDTWVVNSYSPAQIEARPGGPMYAIYGYGFERAPEGAYTTLPDGSKKDISGEVIYDANTGYPINSTSERKFLGNVLPKWTGGINNSISWRGLRLSFSVDASFGGKAYSYSHGLLSYTGKMKNSLPGRYDGLIGDGYVYDAATDTYSPNKTVTQYIGGYYTAYYQTSSNSENNVFSTSYIKFREARFEYSLPNKMMQKTKVFQAASIAVFGRNLAMWTKWPINDPEVASLDGSTINIGMESGSFPMTRSYGINLNFKF